MGCDSDGQMRDLKTIDLIHVRPGDGRDWMIGLQSTSSDNLRTLLVSTMKMFRNSTTLWPLGVSRILMISFLERNCLSHRRLKPPRFSNRKLSENNSYHWSHP